MLNFGGFWLGIWVLFLYLISIIPCILLGVIKCLFTKEKLSSCIDYYQEGWFQFIDKIGIIRYLRKLIKRKIK